MSRFRKVEIAFFVMIAARIVAALWTAAAEPALAAETTPDTVTLRDGSTIKCRLVSVDARQAAIEREDGSRQAIARAELVRIDFGQAAPPPIVARVHVADADDLVSIRIDGREIASPAELQAGWVDIAPLLREGPNLIEAEVENHDGTWAYRWLLEAGPHREVFACGLAGRTGCRENGRSGKEKGVFPAGRAYLYVHRDSGEITVQKP